jgi:hypothetical protein
MGTLEIWFKGEGVFAIFRKTTIKMLCGNKVAAPIWSGHA